MDNKVYRIHTFASTGGPIVASIMMMVPFRELPVAGRV
jgi:hypothetical protein